MEKYQGAAEQLREKIKSLEKKVAELQHSNGTLRDELAETLNENYVNQAKIVALLRKQEILSDSSKQDTMSQEFEAMQRELIFIKQTNFYKIWEKYHNLPEGFRRFIRGVFNPIKKIWKAIKRAFK